MIAWTDELIADLDTIAAAEEAANAARLIAACENPHLHMPPVDVHGNPARSFSLPSR